MHTFGTKWPSCKSDGLACCVCRSFYPLYPPALGSCLDSSRGAGLELPCTPDVLLLPSDLTPFAKLSPRAEGGTSQVRYTVRV